jgi:hypothetical protein
MRVVFAETPAVGASLATGGPLALVVVPLDPDPSFLLAALPRGLDEAPPVIGLAAGELDPLAVPPAGVTRLVAGTGVAAAVAAAEAILGAPAELVSPGAAPAPASAEDPDAPSVDPGRANDLYQLGVSLRLARQQVGATEDAPAAPAGGDAEGIVSLRDLGLSPITEAEKAAAPSAKAAMDKVRIDTRLESRQVRRRRVLRLLAVLAVLGAAGATAWVVYRRTARPTDRRPPVAPGVGSRVGATGDRPRAADYLDPYAGLVAWAPSAVRPTEADESDGDLNRSVPELDRWFEKSLLRLGAADQRQRLVARAEDFVRWERYAAARGYLERARHLGDDAAVRELLAAVNEKLGQIWPAIGHLRKAADLSPSPAPIQYRLFQLYDRVGKQKNACAALRAAAAARPEWAKEAADRCGPGGRP